jgi:hypothetical protein
MQTVGERDEVCVWFAGGSAVLAEGLCNTEGDLQESASEGDEMRNRPNPYAKATPGLMKETRSNPKWSAATKRQRRVQGQQKEGPRAPHHGKAEEKKISS